MSLNGNRLTLEEVKRALGLRSRNTVTDWGNACPYLDGKPLVAATTTPRTWSKADVDLVLVKQREVETGHWTDGKGNAWLSQSETLVRLRKVRPSLHAVTLREWARQGKLPTSRRSFLGVPRADWYLQSGVERLAAEVALSLAGSRTCRGESCLIPAAVMRNYGWSDERLRGWEKYCPHLPPRNRLEPVYIKARRLKLAKGRPHRGKGKPRSPSAIGLEQAYRVSDLDAIKGKLPVDDFDGEYPDPDGRRFNLARAAVESGISYGILLKLTRQTDCHPEGRLPYKLVRRPNHRHRIERTVLLRDLLTVKEQFERLAGEQLPAGRWETEKEIGRRHKLTQDVRVQLRMLLRFLRLEVGLGARRFMRKIRGQHKKVWYYNIAELDALLADRTVEEAWDAVRRASPAPRRCFEATVVASKQRRGAGGRLRSDDTALVLQFCYDSYITKGMSRARVLVLATKRFGDKAPKDESAVKLYAKRWAGRGDPPLSLDRTSASDC